MPRFGFAVVLFLVTACPESGVDSDTLTTGTSDGTTGTTGVPTTGGGPSSSGTDGTGGSSTGESSTTGEVDVCAVAIDPIPEAEFVSTFINTICAQKVECGCADDMCSVKFKADLEDLVLYANAQGMVYDPDCAAQTVNDYVISRGCLNGEQANYPFCGSCPVYRDDIAVGEACNVPLEYAIFLFSEPCADPAAFCTNDVCYVPGAPLKLGDACASDDVDILEDCEEGTICDYLDSGRCEQALPEGAPCLGPDGTCDGLVCGAAGVCAPYLPPGEACTDNYDCASQYCDNFVCTEYVWICDVVEVDDLFGGVH